MSQPQVTPHCAYVALGANLLDPIATVQAAARRLADCHQPLAASSLYRTAPVGLLDQPDFINAVIALSLPPDMTAAALLEQLFAIEVEFGRQRSQPNAPRTLDLDLLLYDQQLIDSPRLTLPHPRMHQRAFVLLPLLEIAPDCLIPGLGRADALLPACLEQPCQRLTLPLLPATDSPACSASSASSVSSVVSASPSHHAAVV